MDVSNFTTATSLVGYNDERRFQNIKLSLNLIKTKYICSKSRVTKYNEEEYDDVPMSHGIQILNQNITKVHLLQMMMRNLSKSKFTSNLIQRKYLHQKDSIAFQKIESLLERSKVYSDQNIERNKVFLNTYEEKININLVMHETYKIKLDSNLISTQTKPKTASKKYKSNIKIMIAFQNVIMTNMNIDFNKYPELNALFKMNRNYTCM